MADDTEFLYVMKVTAPCLGHFPTLQGSSRRHILRQVAVRDETILSVPVLFSHVQQLVG